MGNASSDSIHWWAIRCGRCCPYCPPQESPRPPVASKAIAYTTSCACPPHAPRRAIESMRYTCCRLPRRSWRSSKAAVAPSLPGPHWARLDPTPYGGGRRHWRRGGLLTVPSATGWLRSDRSGVDGSVARHSDGRHFPLWLWYRTKPSPAGETRKTRPPGSVPTIRLPLESMASERTCVSSVKNTRAFAVRRHAMDLALIPGRDEQIAGRVEGHGPDVFGFGIVEDFRLAVARDAVDLAIGRRGGVDAIAGYPWRSRGFRARRDRPALCPCRRFGMRYSFGAGAAAGIQVALGILRQRPRGRTTRCRIVRAKRRQREPSVAAQREALEIALSKSAASPCVQVRVCAGGDRMRRRSQPPSEDH